jgi:hypothetical protein
MISNWSYCPHFQNDRFICVYNSHYIELSRHVPELPNLCLTLNPTQLRILLSKCLPDDFEIYAEEVKCSNHEYYLALKVRY